jgi:hypothetical protein
MALVYTGTNGLFTHLGKLVKHYNQFKTDATNGSTGLDTDMFDILDTFQAANQDLAVNGLVSAFNRWKGEYTARRTELTGYALARLRDKDSVLDEIGAASTDEDEILSKLIETMEDDAATIKASVVAIGAVTADADNSGGGTVFTTSVLDGATSPGSINGVRFPVQFKYLGLATELCAPTQKLTLRVTADSFHDGLAEGSEQLTWDGTLADDPHGIGEDGSGRIGVIYPIHATTAEHVSNADFETFTANVPDNWTLVAGTAGTNVLAAGSADAAHGTNALLFQGNASASTIEIKQAIATSKVVGRKRYFLSVKLKRSAATTGTLTIQFEGTGYTAGGSEKINIAVSSIGTSYSLHNFFMTMPALVPSDFRLVIRWSGGTPAASEKVFIDDLGFAGVYYGAGIGLVIVRNTNPLVREDRYTLTVTNTEGVFQSFFRRAFGVQLPSHATTPSIADSLAQ